MKKEGTEQELDKNSYGLPCKNKHLLNSNILRQVLPLKQPYISLNVLS